MLEEYKTEKLNQKNFMLLTQKGDELLDFHEAVEKLPNSALHVEEGGSHGFDGIERHFVGIKEFFNTTKVKK